MIIHLIYLSNLIHSSGYASPPDLALDYEAAKGAWTFTDHLTAKTAIEPTNPQGRTCYFHVY